MDPHGSAATSGLLLEGDMLVCVHNGSEWVRVEDEEVAEVQAMLRGEEDTTVRLRFKRILASGFYDFDCTLTRTRKKLVPPKEPKHAREEDANKLEASAMQAVGEEGVSAIDVMVERHVGEDGEEEVKVPKAAAQACRTSVLEVMRRRRREEEEAAGEVSTLRNGTTILVCGDEPTMAEVGLVGVVWRKVCSMLGWRGKDAMETNLEEGEKEYGRGDIMMGQEGDDDDDDEEEEEGEKGMESSPS
eukprot:767693-Hanusia_phi.AAC.5